MIDDLKIAFDANRRLWDERTQIHRRDESGYYRVNDFLAGQDVLYPIEAAEIGDIRGLRIAHLQCHFGMDSICLVRRGAIVTGLDFSPNAIAEARKLAQQTRTHVQFIEGNVYDARDLLEGEFDMVYTTWGTIGWLPDVSGWARVVASLLKPDGSLYFADCHPMMLCMNMVEGRITLGTDWRTPKDTPLVETGEISYTGDRGADLPSYEWIHPVADMLNAFVGAGLRLDWIREHTRLTWPYFPNMLRDDDGMYSMPEGRPQLPLALSLRATKT